MKEYDKVMNNLSIPLFWDYSVHVLLRYSTVYGRRMEIGGGWGWILEVRGWWLGFRE